MTEVKTSTGLEISVNESAIDDMELLELVGKINEGEVFRYPQLAEKLLGEDGKKRLYDHIRVDGRVPIGAFDTEITEIMGQLKDKKK